MLVESGLVEQRLAAVKEVIDGAAVTDVARRYGVARQTVHEWLRRYATSGLAGVDRPVVAAVVVSASEAPQVVEARIVELRRRASRVGATHDRAPAWQVGFR